jgi:hypothetical protein
VGAARNSPEINWNYSKDKDRNFTVERSSSNKNVGHVNLLRRYDKPWINRRVRSVNLRLDRTLIRRDMAHINVIYTGTTVREEYTTHGLHLNSRGKMRLTRLIAESVCGGHVPSMNSSIPVITHATASPF